ncbi:ribonuclease H-like domain-containing protein [Tanacetum coccineum]
MLQDVKSHLGRCFAMKDLGEAAYILGIKIYRDRSKRLIGLCQSVYIEKILKIFYMENSKRRVIPMQEKLKLSKSQGASTHAKIQRMQNIPYASAFGLIMYDVRCIHPDVAFAQNITSRFQHNPGELYWTTVKNILKYLRNTKDMFLVYEGDTKQELRVSCYIDAGYLTDADDMKSQTGYVFVLNRGVVNWKSTKQISLDLSRLATTLNRLERSIKSGIYKWYQSLSDDENPPPPPQQTPTQQAFHTVSTIKLHILKKGEYDIWAMKMEHYLSHTDYPIWEVIQKGNGPVSPLKMPIKNSLGLYLLPGPNILKSLSLMLKALLDHSSSAHNVAFVSSESTSRTNDVSTAYGVSTSSGYNSQRETSSIIQLENLMYFFVANQYQWSTIDHEYLNSLMKGCSLMPRNQLALTRPKLSASIATKQGTLLENADQKEIKKSRRRDAGNTRYRAKDNGRRSRKQEEPKALVTLDGEGVDWTGHAEDEQENFALMAYSNSGSDTEVTSCSKECVESYAKLKKLYDEQREQLGDASIEIQAYTQALKKVEAQLVAHQKNQLWYEEKIRFMKIDLDDKTDVLTYHKKLLAEAVKEKEELKTKLKNFQSSSKSLSKLLNSQISTRDKSGLGYRDQVHEGVLSYENEVFQSVFDSRLSDVEDSPVHDRFANVEGMQAVPLPMTGNYIPSGPDREVDDSIVETLESVPELVVVEPKVVSQPKVWSDAPIIEEYRETVKEQNTYSPNPKADKRDWNGLMSKRLGLRYGFTKKACFVCGSFSHLIRDCNFHEKRMAKHVELNKRKGKGTGQGENRPV